MEAIGRLKKQRAAKNGSILKRIEHISQALSDGISRTKAELLFGYLEAVFNELKRTCNNIVAAYQDARMLVPVEDVNWIADENIIKKITRCALDIQRRARSRKTSHSSASSASSR